MNANLTDKLDRYLAQKGSISPVEFRAVFNAERLAPRIKELRDRGRCISTCTCKDFEGKKYTRYFAATVSFPLALR